MFASGGPHQLMWSNMFDPEKKRIKNNTDWRRIAGLFRPYIKQEVCLLVSIVLSSCLGLLPPILTLWIIDKALPQKDFVALSWYVGIMVASALLTGATGVFQGYFNAVIGEGIVRDIRTALVTHLHKLPLGFFTETKSGEIINRVSNDIESIDNVLTGTLVTVVSNVFTIITTVIAICVLDWRLAIISIGILPLMIVPIFPAGRKMYDVRKLTRKKRDEVQALLHETLSLSGISLIKSFGQGIYEKKRFNDIGSALMNLEVRLAMVGRWFIMIVTAMVVVGPAIVWLVGGWMVMKYGVTLGIIVTFVALLNRLYGPTAALAGVQVQLVSAIAVFERIFDYLDMEIEKEPHQPQMLELIKDQVAFNDVSFFYPKTRQALEHVSFTIKAGQTAAFVGHSGAGKTTVTQLLPRFYDPTEGIITIDGTDIREFNLLSLRQHMGVVTQETYLFHDTILNNLKYARAEASDEEIIAAAQAASIFEFIDSLPEKFETVVGERGHKLSGGERQRLAIARVLLKNPQILILDEATSSLDSYNEILIQNALAELMKGRTNLIVAHRLSTIIAADIIFVFAKGRLVEQGTHDELMALGAYYCDLYRTQFKEGQS